MKKSIVQNQKYIFIKQNKLPFPFNEIFHFYFVLGVFNTLSAKHYLQSRVKRSMVFKTKKNP